MIKYPTALGRMNDEASAAAARQGTSSVTNPSPCGCSSQDRRRSCSASAAEGCTRGAGGAASQLVGRRDGVGCTSGRRRSMAAGRSAGHGACDGVAAPAGIGGVVHQIPAPRQRPGIGRSRGSVRSRDERGPSQNISDRPARRGALSAARQHRLPSVRPVGGRLDTAGSLPRRFRARSRQLERRHRRSPSSSGSLPGTGMPRSVTISSCRLTCAMLAGWPRLDHARGSLHRPPWSVQDDLAARAQGQAWPEIARAGGRQTAAGAARTIASLSVRRQAPVRGRSAPRLAGRQREDRVAVGGRVDQRDGGRSRRHHATVAPAPSTAWRWWRRRGVVFSPGRRRTRPSAAATARRRAPASTVRTPAITLPVAGSMMSPTAFTATSAATPRRQAAPAPPTRSRLHQRRGSPSLPTVAPAPAPTLPSATASAVAAAAAR